ncbi:MAG: GNAT family N-acetyltransferase [Limnochordia bacterium]|nr:GNAT family N-acetyltransferase [Limnochordia bacterium]
MVKYEKYTIELDHLQLEGFFVGWAAPLDEGKHREILKKSFLSLVAIDEDKNKIVGFLNVISDGVLSAYIPLLEVLPDYQGQGIGSELVRRALAELQHLYMIDLCCDQELQPYYEKLGMHPSFGMIYRNYEWMARKG